MNDIIGAFFTNPGCGVCERLPELKDCIGLKKQYEIEINKKGGCSSCRKRSLMNKYRSLIQSRLS